MNEWDRLPNEPVLWYDRFDTFRLLGTGRNLDAAYRACRKIESGRAGAVWRKNAEKWNWQERAEAWDAAERERFRAEDEERRRVAREARIELLQSARAGAWKAIQNAHLSELSEEDARSMLGSLRMLLMDALRGERLELGEPTEIVGDVEVKPFRADELAKAERELQEWRERRNDNVADGDGTGRG